MTNDYLAEKRWRNQKPPFSIFDKALIAVMALGISLAIFVALLGWG